MTTIYQEQKKCALCNEISNHTVFGSSNAFGSPDLDTRPPEMARSTIDTWVQTCPSCGYCAQDISKPLARLSEIVHSDSYQQQLTNPDFPKLANAFLCSSQIQENAGEYAGAGWACIHAAWSCDDAGSDAAAQKCRKKAVSLIPKARENGQQFAGQAGAEEATMVDLLRRSGEFERALQTCDDALKKNPDEVLSAVLRFQKLLIGKSDVGCHTIVEATGTLK